MNSQCCVMIGNGTSMLDTDRGTVIDQFPTVVRFNQFEIDGYQKQVGTKTDIWFCGLGIKPDNWRSQKEYRQIILHSWHKDPYKCPVIASFQQVMPDAAMEKVDHKELDAMRDYCGTEYWHWSTGAIGIWLMIRRHPVVYLAGFDWWERPQQHYFRPDANRGTLHQPQEEKRLIDRLREAGKVEFL